MKRDIGVVRELDELGRIVIPREIFENRYIKSGDSLEIFITESEIVLRKYTPGCLFCDEIQNLKYFKGKQICKKCLNELTAEH